MSNWKHVVLEKKYFGCCFLVQSSDHISVQRLTEVHEISKQLKTKQYVRCLPCRKQSTFLKITHRWPLFQRRVSKSWKYLILAASFPDHSLLCSSFLAFLLVFSGLSCFLMDCAPVWDPGPKLVLVCAHYRFLYTIAIWFWICSVNHIMQCIEIIAGSKRISLLFLWVHTHMHVFSKKSFVIFLKAVCERVKTSCKWISEAAPRPPEQMCPTSPSAAFVETLGYQLLTDCSREPSFCL